MELIVRQQLCNTQAASPPSARLSAYSKRGGLSLPAGNICANRKTQNKTEIMLWMFTWFQAAFLVKKKKKKKERKGGEIKNSLLQWLFLRRWSERNEWPPPINSVTRTGAVEMKPCEARFYQSVPQSRRLLEWLVLLIVQAALPAAGQSFDNRKQMCDFWLDSSNYQLQEGCLLGFPSVVLTRLKCYLNNKSWHAKM